MSAYISLLDGMFLGSKICGLCKACALFVCHGEAVIVSYDLHLQMYGLGPFVCFCCITRTNLVPSILFVVDLNYFYLVIHFLRTAMALSAVYWYLERFDSSIIQVSSCETDSYSASQENLCFSWNPEVILCAWKVTTGAHIVPTKSSPQHYISLHLIFTSYQIMDLQSRAFSWSPVNKSITRSSYFLTWMLHAHLIILYLWWK